ncbi:MAG: hypothetical protein A2W71_01545 [Candidatus Nealsonbacteria bacterium RIFCSPLOWO2_02_39_8]|uniref:Uncharacterized protein n=1 Tax=Candidatus Nealsonbacteria bacterium RIFCSPLOWO2_02_39_8 TaxID=1801674 RepID=A0A1G2EHT5_9BACT|nr:MAG: hypothetical protein A3E18_02340 [Candidatus Nealsonbacteria bacterium RIFCSPHIGHO2_12_FULL_38_18]OGZ25346.1 MAG: hypothetical protein A2W71_01545 [Candidatus Nealsonbacteria bacterium RIFCSPLOWO2_02_39_8]
MFIKELSEEKLKVGSGILRDAAQIFFASMFVSVLINSSDLTLAIFGLLFSIAFWILSLIIIKRYGYKNFFNYILFYWRNNGTRWGNYCLFY